MNYITITPKFSFPKIGNQAITKGVCREIRQLEGFTGTPQK